MRYVSKKNGKYPLVCPFKKFFVCFRSLQVKPSADRMIKSGSARAHLL